MTAKVPAAPNVTNRTMWTGDNLDVLRGLNSESVDLIYLDPPFNSNRDYEAPIGSKAAGAAFRDTWTLSDVDEAWHGEIAEQSPSVYAAIDNAGIVHGKSMKSYLIMMAVRLLEMRRILKLTGSLYLHCDSTACHYLKALLDSVFGPDGFRNEIIWQRTSAHNDPTRFGRVHDVILYYGRSSSVTWNSQYTKPDEAYYTAHDFERDADGRLYRKRDLTAPSHGRDSGRYEWKGKYPSKGRMWSYTQDNMRRLEEEGRIVYTRTGMPRLKIYTDSLRGVQVQDVWADSGLWLNAGSRERVGYPTQKPLALLDRIIKASTNEGDVVLDPFCGCATACVSAESMHREWIGIDLSPLAARLVEARLREEFGIFAEIHHRTDLPRRTDLGILPHYRTHKHRLFGQQEGNCGGCRMAFPFKIFEVDHIVPQSKGGTDHFGNLQMLCPACNRAKGTRSQAELIATLRERGMLVA